MVVEGVGLNQGFYAKSELIMLPQRDEGCCGLRGNVDIKAAPGDGQVQDPEP